MLTQGEPGGFDLGALEEAGVVRKLTFILAEVTNETAASIACSEMHDWSQGVTEHQLCGARSLSVFKTRVCLGCTNLVDEFIFVMHSRIGIIFADTCQKSALTGLRYARILRIISVF